MNWQEIYFPFLGGLKRRKGLQIIFFSWGLTGMIFCQNRFEVIWYCVVLLWNLPEGIITSQLVGKTRLIDIDCLLPYLRCLRWGGWKKKLHISVAETVCNIRVHIYISFNRILRGEISLKKTKHKNKTLIFRLWKLFGYEDSLSFRSLKTSWN